MRQNPMEGWSISFQLDSGFATFTYYSFKDTAKHTLNLLSNAIKFSDVDIDLNTLVGNELVAMRVKNKAIGIREDEQQYLFKRFLG